MATYRLLTWLSVIAILLTRHIFDALPTQERSPDAGVVPRLSGAPTFLGAGTYPRANKLRDGSIIGAYTAFSGGQNIITIVRSTNGGASWSRVGEAARGQSATHDIDNPYILQLPSGRVLVAFRNHDKTPNGAYTFFRITVCASDDNGATWSYLSTPASDPGGPNGNWEPFLRNANDGSLQIYYSRENNGGDQDTLERTSRNGGVSWSLANTITGAELSSNRDGMWGVATIGGNNLIGVFETETNGGPFQIMSVTSSDDGRSWGNRRVVYKAYRGNAQAPQVVNVGGTLVVSFQTDEDSPGQTAAKIVTSGNGGNSWGNKVTFLNTVSHWPGLISLDNNNLLGLADNGGAKAQRITLG